MVEKAKHVHQQQRFMEVLKFDAQDIKTNLDGRITYQQGEKAWEREFNSGCIYFIACIVIEFLLFNWLFAMVIEYTKGDTGGLILGIIIVLPLIVFLLSIFIKYDRLRKDIKKGEVKQIQGIVNLNLVGIKYLRINTQRFYAQEYILRLFKPNEPYVIYFLPHSRAIVAVEMMER